MAESHNDLSDYKQSLDENIADVMPEKWQGHGRLKIAERGFDGRKRDFAEELLDRLNEKYPSKNSEVLAEKAIEQTEEKLD